MDIGVLVDKVKVICWSGSRQGRIQDFDEIILAPPLEVLRPSVLLYAQDVLTYFM